MQPVSSPAPSQRPRGWLGHPHMDTKPCWSVPRPGVSGHLGSCLWLSTVGCTLGRDVCLRDPENIKVYMNEDRLQGKVSYIRHRNESLPGVEGHVTRACALMLSAGAPVALVGWPSSSLVVPFFLVKKVPLPACELVPLYAPLPSPDQSLVQGRVTPQVGQPLGRHGKPAAPGVQPLMQAAQQESS